MTKLLDNARKCKENGIDAYVIGEIVEGEEKVTL